MLILTQFSYLGHKYLLDTGKNGRGVYGLQKTQMANAKNGIICAPSGRSGSGVERGGRRPRSTPFTALEVVKGYVSHKDVYEVVTAGPGQVWGHARLGGRTGVWLLKGPLSPT